MEPGIAFRGYIRRIFGQMKLLRRFIGVLKCFKPGRKCAVFGCGKKTINFSLTVGTNPTAENVIRESSWGHCEGNILTIKQSIALA